MFSMEKNNVDNLPVGSDKGNAMSVLSRIFFPPDLSKSIIKKKIYKIGYILLKTSNLYQARNCARATSLGINRNIFFLDRPDKELEGAPIVRQVYAWYSTFGPKADCIEVPITQDIFDHHETIQARLAKPIRTRDEQQ